MQDYDASLNTGHDILINETGKIIHIKSKGVDFDKKTCFFSPEILFNLKDGVVMKSKASVSGTFICLYYKKKNKNHMALLTVSGATSPADYEELMINEGDDYKVLDIHFTINEKYLLILCDVNNRKKIYCFHTLWYDNTIYEKQSSDSSSHFNVKSYHAVYGFLGDFPASGDMKMDILEGFETIVIYSKNDDDYFVGYYKFPDFSKHYKKEFILEPSQYTDSRFNANRIVKNTVTHTEKDYELDDAPVDNYLNEFYARLKRRQDELIHRRNIVAEGYLKLSHSSDIIKLRHKKIRERSQGLVNRLINLINTFNSDYMEFPVDANFFDRNFREELKSDLDNDIARDLVKKLRNIKKQFN